MKDNKLFISQKDGSKKEYDLVSYLSLETGDYVVYTDNILKDDGSVNLYVNNIIIRDNQAFLDDVNNEELTAVIRSISNKIRSDVNV